MSGCVDNKWPIENKGNSLNAAAPRSCRAVPCRAVPYRSVRTGGQACYQCACIRYRYPYLEPEAIISSRSPVVLREREAAALGRCRCEPRRWFVDLGCVVLVVGFLVFGFRVLFLCRAFVCFFGGRNPCARCTRTRTCTCTCTYQVNRWHGGLGDGLGHFHDGHRRTKSVSG